MKIECSRQTCGGQSDGQTHKVTHWAPVVLLTVNLINLDYR